MRPLPGLLLLAILAALAACSGGERTALPPDRLVRLTDAEMRGVDPQIYSDLTSIRVAWEQFEGLTRWRGDGIAGPGLADRWTVSGDGRIWTFTLRQGLAFSDGAPIEAGLFERLWRRLGDPATASPHAGLFAVIEAIEAADARTVRVRLRHPFPQLPALLAHPAMAALPLHRGADWAGERPIVASGPYRLTEWRLGSHTDFARNPRWHGGAAPIASVRWQLADEARTAMRLVIAGEADITTTYPPARQQWIERNYPKLAHLSPALGTYYLAFNTQRAPFTDARTRRALSMAVEREWIADALLDLGEEPAWGVVPPALLGGEGWRPDWADWPRSKRLAAAKRLLAQAGFGPDRPLAFEIRINSSSEHRRIAAALAEMWRPLGVEASILNSEATLHFAAMRRGEFQLARTSWIADLPSADNFLSVHASDAGAANYSSHSDPGFDALLERARASADPGSANRLYRAAEAKLAHDSPVLPIYHYSAAALVSPRVVGWRDNAANVHPSADLSLRPATARGSKR